MATLDAKVIISASNQLTGPLKSMSGQLGGFAKKMQSLGTSMQSTGAKLSLGLTAPLVGIGREAFRTAADFEDAMNQIVGLVGVGKEEVKSWVPEMEKMARETGRTMKDLGEALYFITSSGFSDKSALPILEASAKAAAAGLGDMVAVADLVTSAVNAYGGEVLSASQATDVLVGAVKEGKAEANAMAAEMGKVLPFASQLGVSFDEAAAAVAGMTRTGTDAATATTQLRAVFAGLLKPSVGAEKALKKMGTTSAKLRAELGEENGLYKVLNRLRLMQQKYGETSMAEVFPNIRALAAVLDLTGKNAKSTEEIFKNMANVLGLTDDAFKKTEGSSRALNRAYVEWDIALGHIGDAMMPTVLPLMRQFSEYVGSAAVAFTSLDKETQATLVKTLAGLAALGPSLAVAGFAIEGVGKSIGFLAGAAASPAMWGLAAVGLAVYSAYENWDVVAPAIEEVAQAWDELASAFDDTGIGPAISETAQALAELAGVNVSDGDWSLTRSIAQSMADALRGLAEALRTVKGLIEDPWDWSQWSKIGGFLSKMPSWATPGGAMNSLMKGVTGYAGDKAQQKLGGATTSDYLGAASRAALGPIAPAASSLADAVGSAWNSIAKSSPLLSDGPVPVRGTVGIEEPIPMSPVELKGNANANVTIKVEGPGTISNMSSWDDGGALRLNLGTSNTGGEN